METWMQIAESAVVTADGVLVPPILAALGVSPPQLRTATVRGR